MSDAGGSSVALSTEQAHSGAYSLKVSSASISAEAPGPGGGGIYRVVTGISPQQAYYSAWYYVPQSYVTTTPWTILRFAVLLDPIHGPFDIDLWSQPDGTMTLEVYDTNRNYLLSALPAPPPIVVPAQWFQLEAFFRNASSSSGRLTVWFNGTQIYDLLRPTNDPEGDGGQYPLFYFEPCSLINQFVPLGDAGPNAELYIDDVAISWTRVTPEGVLQVPQ